VSPVLSRYDWSAFSTKIVSIFKSNKERIGSPGEGVSQAPDSALSQQDCQKRFPRRFARSGPVLTNCTSQTTTENAVDVRCLIPKY